MDSLTYRIPAPQRRRFLCWGVGLWLPPVVFVALSRSSAMLALAVFFAVLALVMDLVYLNLAHGRTTVSATGIVSGRPLGTKSWTWDEVDSVRAETVNRGRGGALHCVVLRSVDGHERRLAVPYSMDGVADETFEQTANAIIADWHRWTFNLGIDPLR